jgi:4-carboxymuconolactone decarboxylase
MINSNLVEQKVRFLLTTTLIFLFTGIAAVKAQVYTNNKIQKMTSFIDKGSAAPAANFTGTVWVNMNVKPEEGYNINVGTVTFEPKARTNWHKHSSGQLLFVIEGIGYYQEKDKPIELIQKGDVVKIPKNTLHWHGASNDSMMRHIALVPEYDKDLTEWLQPVSDEEYDRY